MKRRNTLQAIDSHLQIKNNKSKITINYISMFHNILTYISAIDQTPLTTYSV